MGRGLQTCQNFSENLYAGQKYEEFGMYPYRYLSNPSESEKNIFFVSHTKTPGHKEIICHGLTRIDTDRTRQPQMHRCTDSTDLKQIHYHTTYITKKNTK